MRIGIMTGGGDVPGLNACIRALIQRSESDGHTVLGIRRGWEGLLHFNPDDPRSREEQTLPLEMHRLRPIDRAGDPILPTSRVNPAALLPKDVPAFLRGESFDEKARGKLDYTSHILASLQHLQVDVLIVIGGDDTISFATRLYKEGVPILAIPKTMDNDVFGSDYCLGFSSAITRGVIFIQQLRASSSSQERLAMIELFGRNSGEACLFCAYLSGVDRCIIPEVAFDPEKLAHYLVKDWEKKPYHYAMAAISEGARFVHGSRRPTKEEDPYYPSQLSSVGLMTAQAVERVSGLRTIYQQVGYLMRGGAPDALDLMVAANFANLSLDLVAKGIYGKLVAIQSGHYTSLPVEVVTQGVKRVDVEEFYDRVTYRPSIRRAEGKPLFLF